jgi:hypothetical protein
MALTNASGMADYLETQVLNLLKGTKVLATPGATAPAAPTFYAGLFTTTPTDTGTVGGTADGVEMTTTSGATGYPAYARVVDTFGAITTANVTPLSDATGQEIQDSAALSWAANNGSATVTVTAIGVWDAPTGGNLWDYIPLASPQQVSVTSAFAVAASAEAIAVD